jgi:hypothetical protein
MAEPSAKTEVRELPPALRRALAQPVAGGVKTPVTDPLVLRRLLAIGGGHDAGFPDLHALHDNAFAVTGFGEPTFVTARPISGERTSCSSVHVDELAMEPFVAFTVPPSVTLVLHLLSVYTV